MAKQDNMRKTVLKNKTKMPEKAQKTVCERICKRICKRVGCICFATILTAVFSGTLCGCQSRETPDTAGPEIVIGVAYDRPMISSRHAGDLTGFDVEVAKYVAEKLGFSVRQIEWRQASDTERDTLIQSGIDMIFGAHLEKLGSSAFGTGNSDSGNSDSEDSGGENGSDDDGITFAGPYINMRKSILVKKNAFSQNSVSQDDFSEDSGYRMLKGKNVCVADSQIPQELEQMNLHGEVNAFSHVEYSQCETALLGANADAIVGDSLVLAGLESSHRHDGLEIINVPGETSEYGIALKAGQPQLKRIVESALRKMVADGTWKKQIDKLKADLPADMNFEEKTPQNLCP